MDTITFLIGIVLIVGSITGLGLRALMLHHIERMTELRIEEHAGQAKYALMDKALENKLPPGRFDLDNL